MTEETKEVAKKDEQAQEVDAELVTEACETITKIFSTHLEDAVKETGEYLIETFFDNDFEKAKKKENIENSSKGATLNKVFDYFRKESLGPSKSWLYQTIDFVVQEKELEENLDKKTFQTYGKLLLSHKIQLLRVPDKDSDIKKGLILDTIEKGLTVRELKDEISKKIGRGERSAGLLTMINKPELLFEEEYQEKLSLESIKKLKKKLELIPDRIKKKKAEIDKILNNLNEDVEKNKNYLEKLNDLEPTVKQAIEENNNEKKKNKSKS
jgi:hypothetical protein